jgi:hypothetical protein
VSTPAQHTAGGSGSGSAQARLSCLGASNTRLVK